MKKITSFILACILLFGAIVSMPSCDVKENKDNTSDKDLKDLAPAADIKLPDGNVLSGEFVDDQLSFAVGLFKKSAAHRENDGNLLISPTSVMIALAMTANGADQQTLEDMERVLGGLPIDSLNTYLGNYMQNLPSSEKYKLSIANSVWLRDTPSLRVNDSFLEKNRTYYGARVEKAAFDLKTVDDINLWVDQNTDGMIKKLLEGEIDPSVMMYLINAICFDAKWEEQYMEWNVIEREFTAINGEKQQAQMMWSEEHYYIDDGDAVGFIKNYEGGYRFVTLLPNEDMTVYEYIEGLDAKKLANAVNNAQRASVNAGLPKFSYEYSAEMRPILTDMGMGSAFAGGNADFSKMAECDEGPIEISRVLHKTFIELTEYGTRAAAVTSVEMVCGSAPSEVKEVVLDRPFVYMIVDNNNLPIFIGAVTSVN